MDIDFEDVSGNTAYDLSDNHLDATVTNGSFVEDNGSTVLSFNGNGSMSCLCSPSVFPYEASFDLKVTKAPAANTKLFSSKDGTFYLNHRRHWQNGLQAGRLQGHYAQQGRRF